MPIKNFYIYLDDKARIFVYYCSENGKIIKFVVKLELFFNDKWFEIQRYDVYHDCVHKDIMNLEKEKNKTIFYDNVNIESGLTFAIKDFKENYKIYIWRFFNV